MMDKDAIIDYVASLSDQEFAALAAEARANTPPAAGNHVPGVGNQPTPRPRSGAEAIRAAEEEGEATGDWRNAFQLKAQRLTQLAHPHRQDPR